MRRFRLLSGEVCLPLPKQGICLRCSQNEAQLTQQVNSLKRSFQVWTQPASKFPWGKPYSFLQSQMNFGVFSHRNHPMPCLYSPTAFANLSTVRSWKVDKDQLQPGFFDPKLTF